MITMRGLILLVPVLLIGCVPGPAKPGWPSSIYEPCSAGVFYVLQVTDIDAVNNVVKARTGREYDPPSGYGGGDKDEVYSFRVRDIHLLVNTGQLIKDNTYHFGSSCGSPYLELYTSETQAKVANKIKEYK